MNSIPYVLALLLVVAACGRTGGEAAVATTPAAPTAGDQSERQLSNTGEFRAPMARPPGALLVIDGAVAYLDSTMTNRIRRDVLLAPIVGRVITRIEMYPAGDSAALSQFGSRAASGVILIETEPR